MTMRNNFFTTQPVEVNWAFTVYQKIFKKFLYDNLDEFSYCKHTKLCNTELKNDCAS